MQMILPPNMHQDRGHDLVVQDAMPVKWISAQQAVGTVEVLLQRPSLADWSDWVNRASGRWATAQELESI